MTSLFFCILLIENFQSANLLCTGAQGFLRNLKSASDLKTVITNKLA